MKKKKLILIVSISLLTILSVGAVAIIKHTKVPNVSENVNIPLFIDTLMKTQRTNVFNSLDTTKTEYRLNKLGFNGKSNVPVDLHVLTAIKSLYEVYDAIYPNYQFINFKGVKELLDKYGLAIGSTDRFICDIPVNKIKDMENFKVSYLFDRASNYGLNDLDYSMETLSNENNGYGPINPYIKYTYDPITQGNGNLSKETDIVKYAKLDMEKRTEKKVFLIIAPKTCFKGESNINGNYSDIKDPIVLAPVEGGYIIVTAW